MSDKDRFYMSVRKILIIVGGILILCGIILGLPVSSRFILLLGHDSILPNTMTLINSLTENDYMLIFLGAGFIIAGMSMFWAGVILMFASSKRKS